MDTAAASPVTDTLPEPAHRDEASGEHTEHTEHAVHAVHAVHAGRDAEWQQLLEATGGDVGRAEVLRQRRDAGEPLGLLLGRARFLGVEIAVAPGVLVPREETEILGRAALSVLSALDCPNPRVIDMCCGSGNLACAIAHHAPGARVWAADLTDACVTTARANAARLGLAGRLSVHQGDLFDALAGLGLEGSADLVVCNPPYISTKKLAGDRRELLRFEPREAFDAGPYGLSIHQRAIAEAPGFLRPGAWFACEFGAGQERQVQILFDRTRRYESVRFERDAHGAPRVAVARVK